jgi:hypothetical protein
MARKSWLPCSVAFALTAVAANADAGPVAGTARELATAAVAGSNVQQVANRVCWSQNGVRRCRSLDNVRVYGYQSSRANRGPRVYGYRAPAAGHLPSIYGVGAPIGYGPRDQIETDPDVFPIGSGDWWQAMDYQDRGGQGNGTGQ